MELTTIGLDIAKNVFQVYGVDSHGKGVLSKRLKRNQVLKFFAQLPACLVGMEACASAHYWARELIKSGHDARLMAPQFVKPYVKTNKTDAADAEAICEAVSRPNMRYVAVKAPEQQAVLALHRSRSGFVKARTALVNQVRGLLGEYGIVLESGIGRVRGELLTVVGRHEATLPGMFVRLMHQLHEHLIALDAQVESIEVQLRTWHRSQADSRRVAEVPGIGWLTATALVASIGDVRSFANGRQLAAWLGLVPRQHSSGGKARLLGISKRGDGYLRTLLVHGARSAVRTARKERSAADGWSLGMLSRRPKNVVVVARAHKHARMVWSMLAHGRDYDGHYEMAA